MSKLVFLPIRFMSMDSLRDWAARLMAELPELSVVVADDEAKAAEEIVAADAVFGLLPIELLRRAQRLRWLQSPMAAPPVGFFYPELVAHPVVVTNVRGIYNDHIGAHIMAYVLTFARGLHRYQRLQVEQVWRPNEGGTVHLPEATMLVVGVGGVGAEAGRMAHAGFGMRVIGIDARRSDAPAGFEFMHSPAQLDALLPQADFVVLTVPHTPQTEGLFDRARLRRMKRSAYFINIGRGMTTRLDDLTAALRHGEIAGAALDVFEQEPLPAQHPLWRDPNVIITPHVALKGPYLDERRWQILRDNSRRFLAGEPLCNVVDKERWF
jgi:phosphoglycerate dehydrogenase-like enzyme